MYTEPPVTTTIDRLAQIETQLAEAKRDHAQASNALAVLGWEELITQLQDAAARIARLEAEREELRS